MTIKEAIREKPGKGLKTSGRFISELSHEAADLAVHHATPVPEIRKKHARQDHLQLYERRASIVGNFAHLQTGKESGQKERIFARKAAQYLFEVGVVNPGDGVVGIRPFAPNTVSDTTPLQESSHLLSEAITEHFGADSILDTDPIYVDTNKPRKMVKNAYKSLDEALIKLEDQARNKGYDISTPGKVGFAAVSLSGFATMVFSKSEHSFGHSDIYMGGVATLYDVDPHKPEENLWIPRHRPPSADREVVFDGGA